MLVTRGAAEVSVMVPRDQANNALKAILATGVFHPKSVEGGEEAEKSRLQRLLSEADNLAQRMKTYLESVGELPEPGEASLGEVRDWVEKAEEVIREAEELDSKLEPVLKKLTELRTPGTELAEAAEVAKTYRWLDFPLDQLRSMKHLRVRLLRPPKSEVERWAQLAREEPILVAVVEDYEPLHALVIVVYPAEYEMIVNSLAGETNAKDVVLPSEAPQNLAEAARYFEELEKRLEEELRSSVPRLKEMLAKLLTVREAIRVLLASASTRLFTFFAGYVPHSDLKRFADEVLRATGNQAVITSKGYVRVEEELETPSVIRVPKFLKPFEAVLATYGLPRPREISPIIIMAITFPLIFGMAFPDAGHGLAILLIGLYMLRKGEFLGFARGEGVRQLGLLLVYLGVAAMVFGFLAGEFFGPLTGEPIIHMWCSLGYEKPPYATPLFVAHITELVRQEGGAALAHVCPGLAAKVAQELGLLEPGAHVTAEELARILAHVKKAEIIDVITAKMNMMQMTVYFSMYVSLLLGAFLLTLSSLFGFYNLLVAGEKAEAIVSGLSKLLVFGGAFIAFLAGLPYLPGEALPVGAKILGAVAGLSEPPAGLESVVYLVEAMIYGGLALAFFGKIAEVVMHGGGFAAALGNAALEVFDLLLIAMGNTLSFLRIFALSLAHSGLMYGFYIMSVMAGPALPIIYILGNLVVIGMESIVAFAHTLRLHYYEMFSKFLIATGQPFQPARAYARIA